MLSTKKMIVISGINLVEGGTLTVLQDCIRSAELNLSQDWELIALVNNASVFDSKRVRKQLYPLAKKSWLIRVYYEWIYFYFLSRRLKADLWLSLHDITPNVKAVKKAVYCHNPSPFYHFPFKDVFKAPKFWLFNKFYKYLYAVNIKKNDAVIVQQSWLRERFKALYGALNIVVAYPTGSLLKEGKARIEIAEKNIFIYPALPRVFKNFEVICEAVNQLNHRQVKNFKVMLTIDGSENQYSRQLRKQFDQVENISFIGLQDHDAMGLLYSEAKTVLFPSKLETWGLPITEAKAYGKHLLVADLPYAKETVGSYDRVSFFNPDDAMHLSRLMEAIINDDINHSGNLKKNIEQPFSGSWDDLWSYLTRGL